MPAHCRRGFDLIVKKPIEGRPFLDSNILIYALSKDLRHREIAQRLISEGAVISVQSLNEFVSVARRKLLMPWPAVHEAISDILYFFPAPRPLTLKTHKLAIQIAEQFQYHLYDSLIVAAALEAGSRILYSQDMQHGQVIQTLTIRNPFRAQ